MIMLVGTDEFLKIHLQFFETLVLAFNSVGFKVLISVIWLLALFCEIQ